MSSLRPLATITLLAAIGVFLYMKINETEPALPPGLGEWTLESPEIGGSGGAVESSALTPAQPAAADAPPFMAAQAATPTTPAAANATGAADDAPAWTPEILAGGSTTNSEPAATTPAATKSNDESSTVARTAEAAPVVPPIPPLPGTSSSAESSAAPAAGGATPSANTTSAAPASTEAVAAAATQSSDAAQTSDAPSAALSEAPKAETPAATTQAPAPAANATADAGAAPDAPATTPAESPKTPEVGYAAARIAVQGALDRGQLAQALLLLSDWYGDPSLTPEESQEVETLLSQLAGSVIYDGPPAHRLEKPYIVQAGDTLDAVAAKYDVPPQLLAKINGIPEPYSIQPGQELKVVRGPFSAVIELGKRRMTLMLDRRYAGQFTIEIDPDTSVEEGTWKVDQKLLTPASPGLYSQPGAVGEERSLLLANPASANGQAVVLRGPGGGPLSPEPRGRVIRLKAGDVNDVYDILSEGSRVTIRR